MSAPLTPLERFADSGALYEPEREYCEQVYWLWLAELLGPAHPRTGEVVQAYETARAVYEQRFQPDKFALVAGAPAARRLADDAVSLAECEELLNRCDQMGIHLLTCADPAYPEALRSVSDLPLVLYCTGQTEWLNQPHRIGIVGSRRPSQYGAEAAAHLGDALAKAGALIVSGLADGLDSEGHKAAVANHAPTIAVLGVAIDKTYPVANGKLRSQLEQNGVVISEYAPGCSIGPNGFLQRNRIIASLSQALVVVEARKRSGTMSTVEHAKRYGRPVFAVPGSIFSTLSEGTNELLRAGIAKPAVDPQDLLETVGLAAAPVRKKRKSAPAKPVSANAAAVLARMEARPKGLSALLGETGLPMGVLLGALTELELAGLITAQPGRQYLLK